MVYHLTDRDLAFPSPLEDKHETGVIAIGGGPTPARLALAYSFYEICTSQGIYS